MGAVQSLPICNYWLRVNLAAELHLKEALLQVLHHPKLGGLPKDGQQLYHEMVKFKRSHQSKLNKVLKENQWNVLCSPYSNTTSSHDWDVTLIVAVLIDYSKLQPPHGGWKQALPLANDTSEAAFVLLARQLRNDIKHGSFHDISTQGQFNAFWKRMKNVLTGLQYAALEMKKFNDLETTSLTLFSEANIRILYTILSDETNKNDISKLQAEMNNLQILIHTQKFEELNELKRILPQIVNLINEMQTKSYDSYASQDNHKDQPQKNRMSLERITSTGCLLSTGVLISKCDIQSVSFTFINSSFEKESIEITSYNVTPTTSVTYIELFDVKNWETRNSIEITYNDQSNDERTAETKNLAGDGNTHYKITINNTCIIAHPDGKSTNVHSPLQRVSEQHKELKGEFYKGAGISDKRIDQFEEECKQYKERYFECNNIKRYPPSYFYQEDELTKLEECIEKCLNKDTEKSVQIVFRNYSVLHHWSLYDGKPYPLKDGRTLLVLDSKNKLILRIRSATKDTLKEEIKKCNSDLILLRKIFEWKIKEKGCTIHGTVYCPGIDRKELDNSSDFIHVTTTYKKFIITKDEILGHNFPQWWNDILEYERKQVTNNFSECVKNFNVVEIFKEIASQIMVLMSMTNTKLPSFSPNNKDQMVTIFLNDEQREAIYSDAKKIIVVGPYGSGKTLVGQEIVKNLVTSATCKTKIFYICFDPSSLLEVEMEEYQHGLSTENVEIVTVNIRRIAEETGVSNLNFPEIIINLSSKNKDYQCHFVLDEFDIEYLTSVVTSGFQRMASANEFSCIAESSVVLLIQSCQKVRCIENIMAVHKNLLLQTGFTIIELRKRMRSTNSINKLLNLAEETVSRTPNIAYLPSGPITEIKNENKREDQTIIQIETREKKHVTSTRSMKEDDQLNENSSKVAIKASDVDYLSKLLKTESIKSKGDKMVTEFNYFPSTMGHNIDGTLPRLFFLPSNILDNIDVLGVTLFQNIKNIKDTDEHITIICNDQFQLTFITYSLTISEIEFTNFTPLLSRVDPSSEDKKNIKLELRSTRVLVTDNHGVRGMEVDNLITFIDEDEELTRHVFVETIARATVSLTLIIFPSRIKFGDKIKHFVSRRNSEKTGRLKDVVKSWIYDKHDDRIVEISNVQFQRQRSGENLLLIDEEKYGSISTPEITFESFRSHNLQDGDVDQLKEELHQHIAGLQDGIHFEGKIWTFIDLKILLRNNETQKFIKLTRSFPSIVKLRDSDQYTLLHTTAWYNHVTCLKVLIENGADVLAQNVDGWTALLAAAWNGSDDVVKELRQYGNINVVDSNNNTPLHFASVYNHRSTVEELLKYSMINVNIKNNNGLMADEHPNTSNPIKKMIQNYRD